MNTLTVVYSRRRALGSLLIRASSWWGPWSHCGIVDPKTGTVIEATSKFGVVETPLDQFMNEMSEWHFAVVDCPAPELALKFAREQLGKPYDWGGIFAFVAREAWYATDKWFCSELVEAALLAGGRPRFRLSASRITPNQSYLVL